MKKVLSICIPTYNRIAELSEIVDALLTIDSNEFEIVITDNMSTDNTKEKMLSYKDSRVRYCCNTEALPPFVNMIHSIFNAQGKYALYCNDRDVVYPEKIPSLIELLRQKDFAFVYTSAKRTQSEMVVFDSGFESLMNHSCIHHPTGMIYNRTLIGEKLKEEVYARYLQYINTYDFLMLDLFLYGKSALVSNKYWGTREVEFIKKNRSGTQIYFLPDIREKMFYGITDHIFLENDYKFTAEQKKKIIKKVYKEFCFLFCKYKACMADENETAHYGLEKEHVSTAKMLRLYREFFDRSLAYLKENKYEDYLIKYIRLRNVCFYFEIIKKCLKIDLINTLKR